MITTNEWCWHYENKENYLFGRFDSYDDALQDAKYADVPDRKITIILGKVTIPEFADYIEQAFNIDSALECANKTAFNKNTFFTKYSNIFNVADESMEETSPKECYNELYNAIKQWAAKHVYSLGWSISKTEQQKITLFDCEMIKENE